MLFDAPPSSRRSATRGGLASAAAHLALAGLAVAVTRVPAHQAGPADVRPPVAQMVWVPTSAPRSGGGGEGGGNRSPAPVRRATRPGRDAVTVPVAPAASPTPTPEPPLEAVQQLAWSVVPMSAGVTQVAGLVDATTDSGSQGAGTGPGADGSAGAGVGTGRGPGLGPGRGGETGGEGPPGNGVSWPRLLRDVKPAYTAGAMRARITGSVGVSCVVDRDGSVRDCRLTRSLDPNHGLDDEALRVVRLWQFEPARRQAEAVPVRVSIELAFSMR